MGMSLVRDARPTTVMLCRWVNVGVYPYPVNLIGAFS
jgi:hypothetical protein